MGVLVKRYEFEVEIMADSAVEVPKWLNRERCHRLVTIRAIYPRIIHSELMTHRLLSRNSASSRAVPIKKLIEWIDEHPFIPNRFPKTHSGMQAKEWVEKQDDDYLRLVDIWLHARKEAVESAKTLDRFGVSKQIANRILEPFQMYQALVTATEWENFIALRADSAAQNEIRILAEMVLEALNSSTPSFLDPGQWHMPFGNNLDEDRVRKYIKEAQNQQEIPLETIDKLKRKIAVARCARVSYNNFEGTDDYQKDIALFDRLVAEGHWSPFEHVACAMTSDEYLRYSHTYPDRVVEFGWCANFRGFIQFRKLFAANIECRADDRLIKQQI